MAEVAVPMVVVIATVAAMSEAAVPAESPVATAVVEAAVVPTSIVVPTCTMVPTRIAGIVGAFVPGGNCVVARSGEGTRRHRQTATKGYDTCQGRGNPKLSNWMHGSISSF